MLSCNVAGTLHWQQHWLRIKSRRRYLPVQRSGRDEKQLIGIILAAALASPAMAALRVGAKAPDFATTGAVGGKAFKLHLPSNFVMAR